MGSIICKNNVDNKNEIYIQEMKNKLKIMEEEIKKIKSIEKKYTTKLTDLQDQGICNVCLVNPKNGTIVHGSTAHTCCCKECASSLVYCPMCRLCIEKVVTNFVN